MEIQEIIKNAIPGATDEICEFVLWARTPFPCGGITAKELYQSASRFKRATNNGLRLCDMCDRIAMPKRCVCRKCDDALRTPPEATQYPLSLTQMPRVPFLR